ncbi:MAG: amino acid ABC transporter permease [Planctomycetes bacterium]|nr:amino acid ABC transporter permease [Planctomycetota bacterium]
MTPIPFYDSLFQYRNAYLIGLVNTVVSSFSAIIIGAILGVAIGIAVTYGNKYVKIPLRLLIDIIRGIPGLVIIFSIYYFLDAIMMMHGMRLSLMAAGIIALSITNAAQIAELTRGALQAIPNGQIEAGRAIGLRFWQIILYILMPQALVQMLPPWVNSATETVKGSTLLSLIGVSQLLLVTQQMIATNNQALKYYIFIGVVFFVLNTFIEMVGKAFEKRLKTV